MIYLISYDLKVPGRNYDSLYETIKSATRWWHYLESTWIIKTNDPINTWNDRLIKHLDNNDRLLIVDITNKSRNGWLTEKAWTWLRENDG